jgi:hypothetical protein
MPNVESIYAAPRSVSDVADLNYYHTMDVPGLGLVKGPWDDLRPIV